MGPVPFHRSGQRHSRPCDTAGGPSFGCQSTPYPERSTGHPHRPVTADRPLLLPSPSIPSCAAHYHFVPFLPHTQLERRRASSSRAAAAAAVPRLRLVFDAVSASSSWRFCGCSLSRQMGVGRGVRRTGSGVSAGGAVLCCCCGCWIGCVGQVGWMGMGSE